MSFEDLKSTQERTVRFISKFQENTDKSGKQNFTIGYLNGRIQLLDHYWERFEQTDQAMYKAASEDDLNDTYFVDNSYDDVELAYSLAAGYLRECIRALTKPDKSGSETSCSQNNTTNPTVSNFLPKIPLPKFSGVKIEWSAFNDLFKSMIHENQSISNVEKLHYLKCSLSGEAAQLLRNIAVTEDNYIIAWDTLTERYQNERVLINSYLQALTSLQPMRCENSGEVKRLLDGSREAIRALNAMNRPTDQWDDWLIFITAQKLHPYTLKEWESSISKNKALPTFAQLADFLENKVRTLEAVSSTTQRQRSNKIPTLTPSSVKTFHATSLKNQCPDCGKKHFIIFCPGFKKISIDSRREIVQKHKLCFNCLRHSHSAAECQSTNRCRFCSRAHHSLLHLPSTQGDLSTTGNICNKSSVQVTDANTENDVVSLLSSNETTSRTVLLATARVVMVSKDGEEIEVRALLDQGSETCFVSKQLLRHLDVPSSKSYTTVTLKSRFNKALSIDIDAIVLPRITSNLPSKKISQSAWIHLAGLDLADPQYHSPAEVDILVGGNVYNQIILDGVKRGPVGTPIAQRTIFGWILTGAVQSNLSKPTPIFNSHIVINPDLNLRLERFWELEEVPRFKTLTLDEQQCNKHFCENYRRTEKGRFIVRLPTKPNLPSDFGDTREIAVRCMLRLEKRFAVNSQFQEQYIAFMTEYAKLGHMKPIMENQSQPMTNPVYYMPHHGVFKAHTKKLRVVFNASQQTSVGLSLNDCLQIGPKLQKDIREIILRWRKHEFVFCTDIEKMFRQIDIHSPDTNLQRIVWRSSPKSNLQDFCLTTVTYGTSPAPFLANKTLLTLATTGKKSHPLASAAITSDTYVDDILTGADTLQQTLRLQRELIELLESGGFTLRKWSSNCKQLIDHLPDNLREPIQPKNLDLDGPVEALGIIWHPDADTFGIRVKFDLAKENFTKRSYLSDTSRIYDPLGWFTPTTVWTKILFQQLWTSKLDWDDPLPHKYAKQWLIFRQELPQLEKIVLNRWLGFNNKILGCELHAFCDASTKAYGAVVYLRIIHDEENMEVRLLAAKSKVAPIKTQSLPRLELNGAVLLARLVHFVITTIDLHTLPIHAWTDSTVVRAWINSQPSRWKTFIANRVSEIQTTIPSASWHHISSALNPADSASRGQAPSELASNGLWWKGPKFLLLHSRLWPNEARHLSKDIDMEEKPVIAATTIISKLSPWELINRWSSLNRLLRVTAYCLRWFKNHKLEQSNREYSHITTTEIESSLIFWVKEIQRCSFPVEIKQLTEGKPIAKSSHLIKLSLFLDDQDLLRVGGRLQFSSLNYDTKHPLLLPKSGHFNNLLIRDAHQRTLHGGNQLVLNFLRSRFWLLDARNQIRRFIGTCQPCSRYRGQVRRQMMGNLPHHRVNSSRPFDHAGVDYAGPLIIKTRKGRGYQTYKGYVCSFVCFATKAIHVELVSELTTQGFLAAYRRFTSRRGICSHLYSDNGTNFTGASAEMKCLYHQCIKQQCGEIAELLANDGTSWHFIPPAAPHFGGLWEAGVKSLKHHLLRVIGQNVLTYEELNTLLVQVEGCLNSRPLYPMSSDPNDLAVLTPGHFLGTGKAPLALPEPSTLEISPNRLSRWQHVQQMNENLWSRWSKEYISNLQQRNKWQHPQQNNKVGDLVLVKEDRLPPSKWLLGRVTETFPGKDGHTRVATVRCRTSIIRRPIVKLCVLYTESCDASAN